MRDEVLVLLSGRGEEGAIEAEQAVREAAPACTISRSAWFDQTFSEGVFLQQVLAGEVALPVGAVGERSSTPRTSPTARSLR